MLFLVSCSSLNFKERKIAATSYPWNGNTVANMLRDLNDIGISEVVMFSGQKLGEGKKTEAYNMAKKMVVMGLAVGFVLGGLAMLFGKPILSLFDFTPEGADMAWRTFMIFAAMLWLDVYNATIVTGVLRCGGDTVFAAAADVGTVWVIGVPAAFITALGLGWPIYFAVLAVKTEAIAKGVLVTIRLFSKKWVKNVINDLQ